MSNTINKESFIQIWDNHVYEPFLKSDKLQITVNLVGRKLTLKNTQSGINPCKLLLNGRVIGKADKFKGVYTGKQVYDLVCNQVLSK